MVSYIQAKPGGGLQRATTSIPFDESNMGGQPKHSTPSMGRISIKPCFLQDAVFPASLKTGEVIHAIGTVSGFFPV
jgi:hypothetical protein